MGYPGLIRTAEKGKQQRGGREGRESDEGGGGEVWWGKC